MEKQLDTELELLQDNLKKYGKLCRIVNPQIISREKVKQIMLRK